MRLAIISDTHFGDPMGTLIVRNKKGKLVVGPKYNAFKDAAGQDNDYLVLLGDIFDFSIVSYQETYEAARVFFLQIKRDRVAKEIIFVLGNHDADLWHTVEHEVNIIYQIKKGKPPRPFRLSLPGIIDNRKDSSHPGFTLPGVTVHARPDTPKYAGLFLDQITEPEEGQTYFNFAYPNIYLITPNESVLMTHGQYLEKYWAWAGELGMTIAQEDLKVGGSLNVKEMVGINFPLSQLACSGIGQAEPLTKVVRQVQRDVKDGNLKRVKKYLDRLNKEIDQLTWYPWYRQYLEWLTDTVLDTVKRMVIDVVGEIEETRYSEEFIHKKDVQDRFWNFYNSSLIEINQLNQKYDFNIPAPWYMIFGHTHRPIAWGAEDAPKTSPINPTEMKPITLFNTGGWLRRLNEKGEEEFCGAEVFTYETDKGFSSVSVG